MGWCSGGTDGASQQLARGMPVSDCGTRQPTVANLLGGPGRARSLGAVLEGHRPALGQAGGFEGIQDAG